MGPRYPSADELRETPLPEFSLLFLIVLNQNAILLYDIRYEQYLGYDEEVRYGYPYKIMMAWWSKRIFRHCRGVWKRYRRLSASHFRDESAWVVGRLLALRR